MSRIIRLQAEGFKRLVAVDITPEGDLIQVRGNNGEGKSSVLDAIFAALGGAAAAPVQPVRAGEEYAIIRADLGDLRVTRYFDKDGTDSLKVTSADGKATYDKPQTVLNELVGSIAFDPLEFARMAGKDQAAELRRLVPLEVDLDAMAKLDRDEMAERRDINRDAKGIKVRFEAIEVDPDLPEEAPDREALVEKLSAAAETNGAIESERNRRDRERQAFEGYAPHIESKRRRVEELRAEADRIAAEADTAEREAAEGLAALAALPPLDEPVDTAKLREEIAAADALLARIAKRDERKRLAAEHEELRLKSEALTASMAARNEEREKALAAAKMPVEGLSLATIDDELLVTFNGVPFSQSSSAEQLRVSVALAMAANPKLKVIMVKDGSLLDGNGLKLLAALAAEHGFQIWGEFVGEGDGVGIIMEAGKVKGAGEPERVEPPKRRKKGEVEATAGEDLEAGDVVKIERGVATKAAPEKRKPQAMGEMRTPTPGQLDL